MYARTGLVRFSQRVVTCIGCLAALSCGDDEMGAPVGWAGAGGGAAGQLGGAGTSTAGSGGASGRGSAGRGARAGASAAGIGGASGAAGVGAVGGGGRGAAGSGGPISPPGPSTGTYAARDGALYDSCGEQVVLRGVNHPTIYVDRQGAALPEIAKTGANAVRLFWFARNNVQIREAEASISRAIELGMIPILELHDSTCAWNLDGIVNYWTSAQAIELIQKYEAHLIVNVANEPSPPSATEFRNKYISIIQRMRQAGIRTPLMIDGGNCGRDYQVILAQGPALLEADPDHNIIFSAHLYNRMSQASYAKVFSDMRAKNLTFVVGEFAHKSPPGCGGALDYAALISEANTSGVGWLAWSWGDDDPGTDWNEDCGEFDMTTTFSFDTLRGWGREVALDLPGSIKNTSKRPASLSQPCSN